MSARVIGDGTKAVVGQWVRGMTGSSSVQRVGISQTQQLLLATTWSVPVVLQASNSSRGEVGGTTFLSRVILVLV